MAQTRQLTLIFDLDGTLVDTAPDLIGALNHVLQADGMPPVSQDIVGTLVGRGARAMICRALDHHKLHTSDGHVDRLVADFVAYYRTHIADQSRVFPGVFETLEAFKQDGCVLGVCTNKRQDLAVELLKTTDLQGYFNAVCGGDTFAVSKPDPRHLTGTIVRAGGDIDQAIMIGDSETDIRTAKAAKIPVIGVTFGYSDQPIDTYSPDYIVSDFTAIREASLKLRTR